MFKENLEMSISRRNILKRGALCVLFAGVPAGIVRAASASQKEGAGKGSTASIDNSIADSFDRLYSFTTLTFSPYLNTPFRFKSASGKNVSAELVEVLDLRPAKGVGSAEAGGAQSFSLLFRGSNSKPLASSQYTITHDALGTFALFVSPVVSKDKNAIYYEAIISHRRP
jgi:hypothetical protein